MSSRVWAFVVSLFCLPPLSLVPSTFFSHFYLFSVLNINLHVVENFKPNAHPQNEEYCSVAIHKPLTQSRKPCLTTINLRKKNWDLLEFFQKFAHKLSWNGGNWRALVVDRTFYGPWTNLLVLSHNTPSGVDWQENERPPEQTHCDQRFGKMCLMRRNAKKSKSGLSRNQSSTTSEDCVIFISLILIVRNIWILRKMRVVIWKFRCEPQCLANFNVIRSGKPVAQLRNTRQNALVLLKPMNPWGNAWKDLLTRITMIILQEKDEFIESLQYGAKIHSYASSNKIPDAKAAVEKEWQKLEKILAWQLTKVRTKNEVIAEARNGSKNSSFCVVNGHLSFEECWIGDRTRKVRDKRLARLIAYIHHTCEFKQCCHVANTAQKSRWGLFQDSEFAGDLEDSKSTSGGHLSIFGRHTFVPISSMSKKQTSVPHSSTEAEFMSARCRFTHG